MIISIFNKLSYCKYYSKILFSNWTQTKESYSQHGEDILVERLFPNGVRSFIDIGANDGVLFSNTYKFAKQGAKGVCIEPSPKAFLKLKLNHLIHPRLKCLQAAVSNKPGHIFLKEDGYEETLSKVYPNPVPKSCKVATVTFDDILKRYPKFTEIDLLSIDVEGHEKEVLEGLNNKSFIAKVIIIESDKCGSFHFSENNYIPFLTNGINIIYLHKLIPRNDNLQLFSNYRFI